jgi:hypothetical protein
LHFCRHLSAFHRKQVLVVPDRSSGHVRSRLADTPTSAIAVARVAIVAALAGIERRPQRRSAEMSPGIDAEAAHSRTEQAYLGGKRPAERQPSGATVAVDDRRAHLESCGALSVSAPLGTSMLPE